MAKEVIKYDFKSRFGSHSSMINEEKTAKLNCPDKVVLTDEYGSYTTDRSRLDSGLADPFRCAASRLEKLFGKTVEAVEESKVE